MLNLDVSHLQHLSQHPELWHQRRIGTSTMEAYAVAGQIALWQAEKDETTHTIVWVIPHHAWKYQNWKDLVNAMQAHDIPIRTQQYTIYAYPEVTILFLTPWEIEERLIPGIRGDIAIAGMSEVSKWPGGNYPEWVYENLPQRVPIVDYRLRAL